MQYMILIYGDEKAWGSMPAGARDQMISAHMQYAKEMADRKVMVAGSELAPTSSATTLRLAGGKPVATDGPFAETKEQLAGFYLIDAKDLDEALDVAAKIPPARVGSIEVRPVRELAV